MAPVAPNILFYENDSFRFEDSNGSVLTFSPNETYLLNNILSTTNRGIKLTDTAWNKVKELIFDYGTMNPDQF